MKGSLVKKELAVVVILLFVGISVIPSVIGDNQSFGNTIYVDDDGGADYTRIQDAIDNASDGDTIFVYSGIYYGLINIHKSIILRGQDKYSTIIDGRSTKYIIVIRKDNTQIIGFTIRNATNNYGAGIYTDISSDNVISDNIIEDVYYGIFFEGYYTVYIINSTISNCVIRRTSCGITTFQSHSHNIYNNRILNNNIGIYLSESSRNNINNNIFENNNRGIWLYHWYMYYLSYSNKITYNSFIENNCGIFIDGNHRGNVISNNNFMKNIISLSFLYRTSPEIPKISILQNYWDRPRLFPKLILGFCYFILPPIIPLILIDWFPAKEPYDIQVPEV